jgi:soluble lytic murein transglycosylase
LKGIERSLSRKRCHRAEKQIGALTGRVASSRGWKIRLGLCWWLKKRYSRARQSFGAALGYSRGLLDDYLHYWTGKLWEEEKNWTQARASYLKIERKSRYYASARLHVAGLLVREKSYGKAISLLKGSDIPRRYSRWRWLLGRALWGQATASSRREARVWWKKMLTDSPVSTESVVLRKWIARGRVRLRLNNSEKIKVARKYNRYFLYRRALRALRGVRARGLSRKERCLLHYSRGYSLRRRRRYSSAVRYLQRALKPCRPYRKIHIRVLYHLGVAYRRRGWTRSSIPWLRKLAAQYPRHFLADDAIFMVATMHQRRRREQKARQVYRELMRKFPQGDMTVQARWRLAYQAYRQKRWKEALRDFRALYANKGKKGDAALYFSGRIWQKRGRKFRKRATAAYLKLLKDYPLGYYSFLSLARLEQLGWKRWTLIWKHQEAAYKARKRRRKAFVLPWAQRVRAGGLDDAMELQAFDGKRAAFLRTLRYRKGRALYRIGLMDAAAGEWRRLRNCRNFPPPSWVKGRRRRRCGYHGDAGGDLLALHLKKVKLFNTATRMFRGRGKIAGKASFVPGKAAFWYVSYPRPFWKFVRPSARKARVDPALAYALMREESGFRPEVVSHANAYGLMQMIIPTAQRTANSVMPGVRITPAMLTNPKINIRLGTAHMRELLNQFGGSYPMVLAGYNAGAKWVRRWLRRNPSLPFDEWVEAVSIKETRKYIKRVLQSFCIYRFMYERVRRPGRLIRVRPWWRPGRLLRRRR